MRITLSLPDDVVAAIKDTSKQMGMHVSGLVTAYMRHCIKHGITPEWPSARPSIQSTSTFPQYPIANPPKAPDVAPMTSEVAPKLTAEELALFSGRK